MLSAQEMLNIIINNNHNDNHDKLESFMPEPLTGSHKIYLSEYISIPHKSIVSSRLTHMFPHSHTLFMSSPLIQTKTRVSCIGTCIHTQLGMWAIKTTWA